ncbi:MAG: hypothetical protein ABIG84_06265 [archaeon]
MQIRSIRQGFSCEHSSVNYEFVTEKKITDDIKEILKRSREDYNISASAKKISMHLDGEDYIDDQLQDALLQKMPLLIYEDYDWWNFILMFDYDRGLFDALKKYESEGKSEYYVSVSREGRRIQLWICVHLDYGEFHDLDERDTFRGLRNLFLEARRNIQNGDYECIKMFHIYCKNRGGL